MRTHPVGDEVFLQTGEEDHVELEAFRGVQGHERDGSGSIIEVVRRRHEGHLRQEVTQSPIGVVTAKLSCDSYKLSHVFRSCFVLGVTRVLQQGEVSGVVEDLLQRRHRGFGKGQLFRFVQGFREGEHRLGDFGTQPQLRTSAERFAQRDVLFFGQEDQGVLSRRTNPTLWRVENPSESQGISRVGNRHQVGNGVLNLDPLIKFGAPNYAIGDGGTDEDIFQRPGLRVRSIKHGHLGVGDTLPGELHYLVGNELRFVVGAIPSEANNLVTRPHIG